MATIRVVSFLPIFHHLPSAPSSPPALLTPAQTESFISVLANCYGGGTDLEHLLYAKLGIKMQVTAQGRAMPFRETVATVVEGIDRAGLTPLLVAAVLQAFPKRREVQMTLAGLPGSEGGRSRADAAAPASAGAGGVEKEGTKGKEQEQEPEEDREKDEAALVAQGVRELRVRLDAREMAPLREEAEKLIHAMVEGTARLAIYLRLQECLHVLQHCQRRLASAARDARPLPGSPEKLQPGSEPWTRWQRDMGEAIRLLKIGESACAQGLVGLPAESPTRRRVEKEWLGLMVEGVKVSQRAADAGDLPMAGPGLARLRQLLRTEPARISQQVAGAVEGLPLGLLQKIYGRVAKLPKVHTGAATSASYVRAWEERQRAAQMLAVRMQALVHESGIWQAIDQSLAEAAVFLPMSKYNTATQFEKVWNGVSGMLEKMVRLEPAEPWAVDLKARMTAMDAALPEGNWPALRLNFDILQNNSNLRLARTDATLKRLCAQFGGMEADRV